MAAPATAAAAEQGSGGLPQFDLTQWAGQMIWALVIFAVLYFVIARVFVPRLGGTIEAREDAGAYRFPMRSSAERVEVGTSAEGVARAGSIMKTHRDERPWLP